MLKYYWDENGKECNVKNALSIPEGKYYSMELWINDKKVPLLFKYYLGHKDLSYDVVIKIKERIYKFTFYFLRIMEFNEELGRYSDNISLLVDLSKEELSKILDNETDLYRLC